MVENAGKRRYEIEVFNNNRNKLQHEQSRASIESISSHV